VNSWALNEIEGGRGDSGLLKIEGRLNKMYNNRQEEKYDIHIITDDSAGDLVVS
jgi:hypothetical protein